MRILAGIGALAIIVAVGAAIFFFGGFFNIAANVEDPGIVNWALISVRTASIGRHAREDLQHVIDWAWRGWNSFPKGPLS